jgi:hypothetical protein
MLDKLGTAPAETKGRRIAIDRLRELLRYCPETGALTWLATLNNRVLAGSPAGSIDAQTGYVKVKVDGRSLRAHRVAVALMTGAWPEIDSDHINGCRADNRWANLRPATPKHNAWNRGRPSTNRSGAKGVAWHAEMGKWRAYIAVSGRKRHLGYFGTVAEAADARSQAEARYYGEFQRTAEAPHAGN